MRIAQVVHGHPPEVIGGTELYVARLARALSGRGHATSVFCGSLEWRERLEVEREERDGIAVTRVHRDDLYFDRWDKGFHPGVSAAFDAFLDRERPDAVHVHHWIRLSSDLVRRAARKGIPAVVTLHDLFPSCPRVFRLRGAAGDESCEQPLLEAPCVTCVPRWRFDRDDEVRRRLETYRDDMRAELLQAAARIAPTAGHGGFLLAMLGKDGASIEVVPHGRADAMPSAAPPGNDGRFHVAAWSHLHPLKGAHLLLEAAARAACRDRLTIHLWGAAVDDAYRARLESIIQGARGLEVVFHGRYEPAQLAGAPLDLAVLPTLCRESWSFTLDEAIALGAPILAADAGALRERANGRMEFFARNDADSLARELDRLAADPARRAAMRAAPAPAPADFAAHVDAVLRIYARVVAAPPPQLSECDLRTDARLAEEWRRREDHFRELVRIERWEDVVAELRRQVADLERALADRAR